MPEAALAQTATYSAVPTVKVDGQANDKVTTQLLSMDMREQEAGLASLELRLRNFGLFSSGSGGFVFEDGAVIALGTSIDVYAGDVTSPTEIFRGKVTALEGRYPSNGPPDLVVLAEDALQSARMKRATKTWDNATLSGIVAHVAANAGLSPVTSGLDDGIGTQVQFNETDLHFLRRLLARYDADLRVVGTELHAAPRSQAQSTAVEIDLNSQLRELRVIADLAEQVTAVTTTGWDYQQGSTISATSATTSLGPGAGRSGSDWLQQAFTTRSDQLGAFAANDQTEAQALADAELAERARRFVVAHGVAEGNPNLRVGSLLTLGGLGPRFSNTYYTTATVHHYDQNGGYETRFTAECAYLGSGS
ncbi:MAG TPA: contractile injection system protein, VgrG/Pvc8 family [Candidatus Elarobacter sp.]|jgi:phage protein D|nr:contractile injection system protein, VgrG/Pvc8 family [Candidatus Elarobacter sp.]